MKFCIYCGQKLDGDEIICSNPECGKPIPRAHDEVKIENEKERRMKEQREQEEERKRKQRKFEEEEDKQDKNNTAILSGKKILAVILIIICIILVVVIAILAGKSSDLSQVSANSGGMEAENPVVRNTEPSVTISEDAIIFDAANQQKEVTVNVENVKGDIYWRSSNPAIADVNEKGVVTAYASGEAEITAKVGDYSVSCSVQCNFSDIHTYELILDSCSWTEAYQKCLDRGGHLVHINSREEYNAILEQIYREEKDSKIFYIGGVRRNDSDTYYWVDVDGNLIGDALNGDSESWCYDLWMDGEPSYKDADVDMVETYMDIFYYSGESRWVWNDCSDDITGFYRSGKVGYICEYE